MVVAWKNLWILYHSINMWHGGCDIKIPPQKFWFNSVEELIIFYLITTKLVFKNDGGGGSRGCVKMASADFCRMRGIEADCSWLKPRTRGEYLTNQLSWAAAWLLVTCSSPVYLEVDDLKSCVLWALMIGLGGPVDVFLRWWVWFYL